MQINKPTLILNEVRCKTNILKMVNKARESGLTLRPHFKTHQSIEIGSWFKAQGIDSITVSSIDMANYFAEAGWNNILIAFPLNITQIDQLKSLAKRVELHVLVDNLLTLETLKSISDVYINVFIEINSGANRSGIFHLDHEVVEKLMIAISQTKNLNLSGCYTHAGNTYKAGSKQDIKKIGNSSISKFLALKNKIKDGKNLTFCYGDTPSCSILNDFFNIDMLSPGNFVFYDYMQHHIGSCAIDQIAVAMYCPIVSKDASRLTLCIYGGAIHFSKDHIEINKNKVYGVVVDTDSWLPISETFLIKLSQEHGQVKVSKEMFEQYKIGDTIAILPIHSCLTAQSMGNYVTQSGKVIDHFAQKKP